MSLRRSRPERERPRSRSATNEARRGRRRGSDRSAPNWSGSSATGCRLRCCWSSSWTSSACAAGAPRRSSPGWPGRWSGRSRTALGRVVGFAHARAAGQVLAARAGDRSGWRRASWPSALRARWRPARAIAGCRSRWRSARRCVQRTDGRRRRWPRTRMWGCTPPARRSVRRPASRQRRWTSPA